MSKTTLNKVVDFDRHANGNDKKNNSRSTRKCNGCGLCESACHEGAIRVVDGKARLVSESFCDGLGACLPECPVGAITLEERQAQDFDPSAVEEHLAKSEPSSFCGCPGSAVRSLPVRKFQNEEKTPTETRSQLAHWPVQLMLVPPTAPFLKNANLLVSADCVPFAYPDFHARFLAGSALLVGCPKLDDIEHYRRKLREIVANAHPASITVLRMEVPCCAGLAKAVVEARDLEAPDLPVNIWTINIDGGLSGK